MARDKMRIEGFENVDSLFQKLGRTQDFCEKAISEAAPELLEATKKSVHKAIYSPPVQRKQLEAHRTGNLERSFRASKPKTNQYGSFSVIAPVGSRQDRTVTEKKKPLHYAAQAAFLEWGTCQGQAPSPWRARAIKDAEETCARTMEKAVIREVSKIWKVEEGD